MMKTKFYRLAGLMAVASQSVWAQQPKAHEGPLLGSMPTPAEQKLSTDLENELHEVLRQAREAVDAGRIDTAVSLFEQAKEVEADSKRAVHMEPNPDPIEEESLIAQRRYPEAIVLLEGPQKSTFNQAWLTILYWKTGDPGKARQAFHKGFYRDSKRDTEWDIEKFLVVNGETNESIQVAARLYIGAHINGDAVSRLYDHVQLLKQALTFVPDDAYLNYAIGKVYSGAHDYKDAIPYLEMAKPGLKPYGDQEDCENALFDCHRYLVGSWEGG